MPPPAAPKIYHIVHVDRLPSIIADGVLWCDAEIARRMRPGTTIGMNRIKQRRLSSRLTSHPDLRRGGSVGLNSFRGAVKWISALVTLPPGLASAD